MKCGHSIPSRHSNGCPSIRSARSKDHGPTSYRQSSTASSGQKRRSKPLVIGLPSTTTQNRQVKKARESLHHYLSLPIVHNRGCVSVRVAMVRSVTRPLQHRSHHWTWRNLQLPESRLMTAKIGPTSNTKTTSNDFPASTQPLRPPSSKSTELWTNLFETRVFTTATIRHTPLRRADTPLSP